jgi:hypothetical protein
VRLSSSPDDGTGTPVTEIVRPGIAYVDENDNAIDLTEAEARHVFDTNEEVRHGWKKWTSMTGQACLPPEKRRGRLVILDAGVSPFGRRATVGRSQLCFHPSKALLGNLEEDIAPLLSTDQPFIY